MYRTLIMTNFVGFIINLICYNKTIARVLAIKSTKIFLGPSFHLYMLVFFGMFVCLYALIFSYATFSDTPS